MLPPEYRIRMMCAEDFAAISAICARVYPNETPYTSDELAAHHRIFPQGQFVAEHMPTGKVAGVHFTLRVCMHDFHIDDSWDVLTAKGSFSDHDPNGHTLYGADVMVDPDHQHHGIAHGLTDATRALVQTENLWRMVGGSRLPGYHTRQSQMDAQTYVDDVVAGIFSDPVLTVHLKDGWLVIRPIFGYLPHDEESAGWAAVIQWVNPACPPPKEFELR
jgi:GNAT superfamily N-acetyltransferase